MVASTLGDEVDSSVGPVMSPVLPASTMSSLSGLVEGGGGASPAGGGSALGPSTPSASSALGQNGLPAGGFRALEPPKSIPDADARRSKARMNSKATRAVGAGDSWENSEGGAQATGGGADRTEPAAGVSPATRGKERDQDKDVSDDDGGQGNGSGGSGSGGGSPYRGERRRRRPEDDVEEPKESSKGGKRRHVPTPRHRPQSTKDAWGYSLASAAATATGAADGGGEGGGGGEELDTSSRASQLTSDFNSSGPGNEPSDLGTARAPSDFASELAESELLPDFDSNTTWAGASALSVTTAHTGGRASGFETSSALSQISGSYRSTASKLDAAVWSQQPARNGDSNNRIAVTAAARGGGGGSGRGRPSPQHVRAPSGTPARRGAQRMKPKPQAVSSSTSKGAGGGEGGVGGGGGGASATGLRPRSLTRPTSTSRRAAMSPHGVAMDAAIRIVEEHGARLGIVREEGDANNDRGRDASYANQIAAPAMTSLEDRRKRAKDWAKSRWVCGLVLLGVAVEVLGRTTAGWFEFCCCVVVDVGLVNGACLFCVF